LFRQIFDPENFIFKPLGKLVDLVCLSVMWFVCSLPLVTLGAATAALYDSTARCVRMDRAGPYVRFVGTLRENLRTGIVPGLLAVAVGVAMGFLYRAVYARASVGERGVWYALYYTWWVAAVVLAGLLAYVLPTLSRFDMKLGPLMGNSLRLGLANLPFTLVLGVVVLAGVLLCLIRWYFLFFVPCLCALLCSFPLEHVFKPYMKGENEPPASE